jgi:hypothetical protein
VQRIFLTLALLDTVVLGIAFWLGLEVGDPAAPTPEAVRAFSTHFLTGVGAIVFATLVHSLVLTYFMGTGRWLDETCAAYKLDAEFPEQNRRLKWRVLPFLGTCVLLLVITGGFGAAADPGASTNYKGSFGLTAAGVHQLVAAVTLAVNTLVHIAEFLALHANAQLVHRVLAQVREIRIARGLPVDDLP